MKTKHLHIIWRDPNRDWPYFWLQKKDGKFLFLKGADYPDGSAKHDGDEFWAHKSDIKDMRVVK